LLVCTYKSIIYLLKYLLTEVSFSKICLTKIDFSETFFIDVEKIVTLLSPKMTKMSQHVLKFATVKRQIFLTSID
jgi:hypothetical protein